MDTLLYGVAYYEEYLPYDRLEEDIRMMKKAGMNVVRIGESTWSTMEPQDHVFDTSHLTRVIEAMGKAGISVILGTPTYAVPTWLVKAYPDILAITKEGRGIYGARQNMDITHPAYLYHAERVIRKMMEACAAYPNVIGVQLDNETKAYGTAGPNVQHGFVKYLRETFQDDLDLMNRAYGLDYWSNRINAWEDFPDVRGTINGSLGAEFSRYQRKILAEFLMWQRNIVEPYLRKDQFITHNTDYSWIGHSYGLNRETDVYENAKAMTIVGTDIYHPSQGRLNGMEIAFGGDLTRSVKRKNYLVLETQAQGQVDWLPFAGQLRLQAYSHLANGADMVEYWHWHSLHNGCETYWKGLLSHDFKENDTYREAMQIGTEWKKLGKHLTGLKKDNRIAILVSNTALTALEWFPISEKEEPLYRYNEVLMELYEVLYKNNLECDFLFPQNAAEYIGRYSLVLIPALYAASETLLQTIEQYVREGGHIFTTFKSGFADENNKVWSDETPHVLGKVCGICYSQFTLPENVGISSEKIEHLTGEVKHFMECLEPVTAKVLAGYEHYAYKRFAAVTRNVYKKGQATYLGCGLEKKALTAIVMDTVRNAGLSLPDVQFPIILRSGQNEQGKRICYYLNYSDSFQNVCIKEKGIELLTECELCENQMLTLSPWGLAVVEGV